MRFLRILLLTTGAAFSLAMVRPQEPAFAELRVTLDARLRGRSASVVIAPAGADSQCTYTLRLASRRSGLASSDSVASWSGDPSTLNLSASRLPGLSPLAPGRRVFLQAVVQCGDEAAESDIQRFSVRRSGTAPTTDRWAGAFLRRLVPGQVTVIPAFPNLTFSQPVDLQAFPDGSNRLAVVEQSGRVQVFAKTESAPTHATYLDIEDKVKSGGERGLLGLAFHPAFSSNGFFFVHYTRETDGASVIARFQASPPGASTASDSTEQVLLVVSQPSSNHNAGQIAFGPDGKLYVAMGDGGGAGDPQGNGQNPATLLGSLLRLDVDTTSSGLDYGIPSDNPFVGNTRGFREETYAYGFRNPWRFSFDYTTGLLWLADVGQSAFEEIDIVEAGKNYGWNTMEGKRCYSLRTACNRRGLALPIAAYGRDAGQSVTGGYVYRGATYPALTGLYVFGDFVSGTMWSIRYEPGKPAVRRILLKTGLNISSFGRDADGEVYLLSYGDGLIYRVQTN